MIEVEGLTKDFGVRRAIDNISFNAEKGEIIGFLGPNGAGKTTTMRILCCYMPPTTGRARVAGYDVVAESLEVRKRVGYLPETVPLYPDMSVFDYLKYMADLRHLKDADDRVDEVLSTVRMLDRADGYISNLSKGMRQRVGIAQALLHQPEVLILDEPTIGLDPAQIVEVRNLIRSIGKQRTILLSTHILSEAQQLCDRVLIINRGKIVVEDTPEDLQSRLIGSQRSYLKIKGDGDGLDKLVSAVPGITNVIEKSDGVLEFDSMPGTDIRPDVVRSVVNAGYDLLEIRPIGISLEEIFMQLTRDEPGKPQTRDDDFVDNPEIDE
jgi:ABC-2 type transport system ATP-binding protein